MLGASSWFLEDGGRYRNVVIWRYADVGCAPFAIGDVRQKLEAHSSSSLGIWCRHVATP